MDGSSNQITRTKGTRLLKPLPEPRQIRGMVVVVLREVLVYVVPQTVVGVFLFVQLDFQ